MEGYKAIFQVNEDDLEDMDHPYGGSLIFLNKNNYEIARAELDFQHFSKITIDNIIKVIQNGSGEVTNCDDNDDFGNGGFFVTLKNNILTINTSHFGTGSSFSVECNLSLLQAFIEMRNYFN